MSRPPVLQMLKIVTHPALQRSVLVTIFHPLSLDCRMLLLREMEGAMGGSSAHGGSSNSNGHTTGSCSDTPVKDTHSSAATPNTHNTNTTNSGTTSTPLTPNHVKIAWDRLHVASCQKLTLLMMYVEHILLERIVATAVDCFPGNEPGLIELDEEYLSSACPAITPLRSVSDPRADAISMLQWLCVLPPRDHCAVYCTSAAVSRSLYLASLPSTPSTAVRKAIADTPAAAATPIDSQVWSSALDTVDSDDAEVTINLAAEYEAEPSSGTTNNTTTNGTTSDNNTQHNNGENTPGTVSFKTAHNASSDSLDGLALPTSLPTSTSDPELHSQAHTETLPHPVHNFISPVRNRAKLGRNDMLLPLESTMGKGLNSADQLMLSALRRLDEVVSERAAHYPEVKVQYSVDPIFSVLCDASAYSITTIQVRRLLCVFVFDIALHF